MPRTECQINVPSQPPARYNGTSKKSTFRGNKNVSLAGIIRLQTSLRPTNIYPHPKAGVRTVSNHKIRRFGDAADSAQRTLTTVGALLSVFLLLICGTLAAAPQVPMQQFAQQTQQQARPLVVQQPLGRAQLRISPGGVVQSGGLAFPQDRTTLRNLRLAQQMVEEKNYTDAAALLGSILAREEDFFFQPDEGEETHTSIKAEVRRMIGELPPEGREAFRLRFGEEAASMLKSAIEKSDIDGFMKVASAYFHTEAGYDAAYLLGQYRLDHGQPLAAGLAFQQLTSLPPADRSKYEPGLSLQAAMAWSQAGMTDDALAALNQLRQERPNAVIDLGGQSIPLPGDENQLAAWLANVAPVAMRTITAKNQWTMFGGDAARNAQASGGMPILNTQWEAHAANNVTLIETLLAQLQRSNAQSEKPKLPTSHPICVNGTYIFRSPVELIAVDAYTGKRLWNGLQDKKMFDLLNALDGSSSSSPLVNNNSNNPNEPGRVLRETLIQRTWGDLTHGTLSSDGRNVYCVEQLPVGGQDIEQLARAGVWINNPFEVPGTLPAANNRLRAYGLSNQGKLMREWPSGIEDDPLEGAFFLGPPLPLGDTLYVLAELGGKQNNGSLVLVALDPHAEQEQSVLWVQTLGVAEQNLLQNPMRRSGGFTPSFSEGVLVCPTGNGAIVGFDLMSRSLLWGYSYPQTQYRGNQNIRVLRGRNILINGMPPQTAENGWADNSVTIVDGKVICGPQDSNQLHCIDLLSGKPAWGEKAIERDDDRFVAGVVDGTMLLVGMRGVRAVDVNSGDVLWTHQLPDQRFPAGRGFFHGDQYHLPMSVNDLTGEVSGEIAIIDLTRQTLSVPDEQQNRTTHVALGNLICYEGAVFSQNALGAQRYDRYEDLMRRVAAQLEANPRDVSALLQQAALWLHDGRFAEAIEKLRLAHEIAGTEQTRSRLLSALLDGLATDYASYREDLDLINQLVQTSEERARLYRTLGHQFELDGDFVAAFEKYLELSKVDPRNVSLHSLSMEWLVRPDRWLQGRVAQLYQQASAEQRAQIDAALTEHLAYREEETAADLRRLLDYFGNLPEADPLRQRLAMQILAQTKPNFLEAESLLHRLQHSQDAELVHWSTATLADVYSQVYVTYAARPYLDRLATDYADVIVRDGQTGSAVAAQLIDENEIPQLLELQVPQGKVTVQKRPSPEVPRSYAVPVVEARGSVIESMKFWIENEQKIQGRTEEGRLLWETQLSEDSVLLRMSQGGQRMGASQHVVVVWTGNHLIGIDALGDDDGGNGREILWIQPLVAKAGEIVNPRFQVQCDAVGTPWGEQRVVYSTASSQQLGARPVIFGNQVVTFRHGELVAFDALTGAELWVRRGLPADTDIFGDDQFVYVATGENLSARTFDAVTGEELPGVSVPPRSNRIAYQGRHIVQWKSNGASVEVALFDPASGQTSWSHKFPRRAKFRLLEQTNEMLTLDEDGTLQIIAMDGGELQLTARVPSVPKGFLFSAFADKDRLYVGVSDENRPQDGIWTAPPALTPVQRKDTGVIFGQLMALDRKTSKLLWEHRVQGFAIVADQPTSGQELVLVGEWGNQRNRNNSNWGRTGISILDKRDGSILFRDVEDFYAQAVSLKVTKILSSNRMRIEPSSSGNRMSAYTLNWTDEPAEIDPELNLILLPGDDD